MGEPVARLAPLTGEGELAWAPARCLAGRVDWKSAEQTRWPRPGLATARPGAPAISPRSQDRAEQPPPILASQRPPRIATELSAAAGGGSPRGAAPLLSRLMRVCSTTLGITALIFERVKQKSLCDRGELARPLVRWCALGSLRRLCSKRFSHRFSQRLSQLLPCCPGNRRPIAGDVPWRPRPHPR